MVAKNTAFLDFIRVPKIGFGVISVWTRNFWLFKNTFLTSFFWLSFEPALYLLAFGWGVGHFLGTVEGMPYIEFFMPALLSITAMLVAFYESSFHSRQRRKNLSIILMSPVSEEEVAVGEILWSASKAFFSVCLLLGIAFLCGLVTHWLAVPAVLVLWVCCWLFAAFGVLLQSPAENTDAFIFAQSGLIIPMSLFCATYFPLSLYPEAIRKIVWFLPLTPVVVSVRSLLTGYWPESSWMYLGYLVLLSVVVTNWAVSKMARQLRSC